MRIISGYFKGKKILQPKDSKTRPLKDLTKESIFNIINHSNKFEINFNGNYNGKFSTIADSSIEIPSYFIFDISFKYKVRPGITYTSKIINLFDENYAVSRAPAGLRPGHPFGIYAGFEYLF